MHATFLYKLTYQSACICAEHKCAEQRVVVLECNQFELRGEEW